MTKLREGKRIRLIPYIKNPTEFGVILGMDRKHGVAYVKIDKIYRRDKFDDGLREVPLEQIRSLKKGE